MIQNSLEDVYFFNFSAAKIGQTIVSYYNHIVRRYYALVNFFRRSKGATQLRHSMPKHRQLPLSTVNQVLLEQIQHRGIASGHLNDLQLGSTWPMWQATQSLILTLPSDGQQASHHGWNLSVHSIYANADKIAAEYPEIIRWGLNEHLLDLIENHMGCPPALVAVALRKDTHNGEQIGTRLWHLDQYDRSVVKVLIYLSDVDQQAGPFEYVPQTYHTSKQRLFTCMWLSLKHKFRKNSRFEKLIPSSQWCSVIGPAGTTIVADTSTILHHGAVPTHGERLILAYTYTTQRPTRRSLRKCLITAADALSSLLTGLSPRQQATLLGWKPEKLQHPTA